MRDVSALAGGHAVLHDITLDIPLRQPCSDCRPSGRRKSSLAGLLLGWRMAAVGAVLVDNAALSACKMEKLRRQIAWIDPTVHLWNRSLMENLRFGSAGELAMASGGGRGASGSFDGPGAASGWLADPAWRWRRTRYPAAKDNGCA